MALFKIKEEKVNKLNIIEINKEKDIQKLFEQNLNTILNIDFLATEFTTSFGGRIDTLGIDKNGCPVIIEYKKTQNESVINQGLSYLKWLIDHKAEFQNLCKNKNINFDIDWNSPRVICVAKSYNKFDLDTVDMLHIKIELLKYDLYEEDILILQSESQQQIVKINTSKIFEQTRKQKNSEKIQKDYSVEDHLKNASKEIKELYYNLKEKIIEIDTNIFEEPKAKYIAFKLTTNITDVVLQKNNIKIFINLPSGELKDPYNIARDLNKPQKIGHWGNGDYEVLIKNEKELNQVLELIKQAYNYAK
jgi:predicted transport protein